MKVKYDPSVFFIYFHLPYKVKSVDYLARLYLCASLFNSLNHEGDRQTATET